MIERSLNRRTAACVSGGSNEDKNQEFMARAAGRAAHRSSFVNKVSKAENDGNETTSLEKSFQMQHKQIFADLQLVFISL